MAELILFWHRRDLRLADNLGLAAARALSPKVVGVFCLDPGILERDDVAPARVAYMLESLRELQENYIKSGSTLLFLQGDPQIRIPALVKALKVRKVFWHLDTEPYSRDRDRRVEAALQQVGAEAHTQWDQLLHPPGTVLTGSGGYYTVYGPFWKNWSVQPKLDPAVDFSDAQGLSEPEMQLATAAGCTPLPSNRDLKVSWQASWPGPWVLAPGEKAAQTRLEEFTYRAISQYDEQRNFPAVDGTACLSPALKFGVIGIRQLWAKTVSALSSATSTESEDSIRVWRQELAWREFYQHVLYQFPELADGPYRAPFKTFPWVNNSDHFQAWCEGRTGYPIVDAAMRQLNETGWMHNRCRMIVASFLTKDLIIDWRWGERYFMQTLVDGDLAANNGGWQWSASSGMDPKPLRIFNPASQAKKFDAAADYIRQWLPELERASTAELVTGQITSPNRQRADYPAPIVDHNLQQKQFKALYAQQKAQ
jgi:deoxyribodipyrimidine photo-lyase